MVEDRKPAAPDTGRGGVRRHLILHGNLRQQIILLALPTLLQQFLVFCVGLFDTWLSGQIDAAATSAIGVSAYIGWLGGLLVSTVSVGTTAMVSRHCGAKEFSDANRVMNVSLLAGQILSLAMAALLFLLAPVFVSSFRLSGRTAEVALNYLRLDALGHVLTGTTIVGAAALRGSGDMKRPMAVLGTISVVNMFVSVGLVYGVGPDRALWFPVPLAPALGVYGIAAGTVTARITGGLVMMLVLRLGSPPLRLTPSLLKPDRDIFRRLRHLGSFAGVDSLVNWCGQFLFLMIIKSVVMPGIEPDAIFAAHVVGIQVEAITYLPAIAWGQSAATVIGQSLGAGKLRRARRAGLEATGQCGVLAAVVTAVFFLGASGIYSIMHRDAQVIEVGVPAFQAMALFQLPLIIFLVMRSALHGAGDTRIPMFASIIGIFTLRLPGAWLFGVHFQMGLLGAWVGMFMDISFRALFMLGRYLRGRWLTTRI